MISSSHRARRRPWRVALFASFALVLASACSLINAFDDVKPLDEGGSVTDAPITEAGETGPDASTTSKGAIVIGGEVETEAGTQSILTALSPEDGTELPRAREKLTVAAVLYDGLRDIWYVFESAGSSLFPSPKDKVFLRVRNLDTNTGEWTNLQTLPVPTLVAFNLVTVLKERIVFVAYKAEDASAGVQLVTIDTASPSQATVYDNSDLSVQPFGLIGTRGSQAGGSVNLLSSAVSACDGGVCPLAGQHVAITEHNHADIGPAIVLKNFGGSAAYGSYLHNGVTGAIDVIGTGFLGDPNIKIDTYFPSNGTKSGSVSGLSTIDPFLKPFAFAECQHQALVVATNQDLNVYALPMESTTGVATKAVTGHSGQGVYFEPFTSTVLAPFSQGSNFELTAFTLGGTETAQTLTSRSPWTPPADLRPEIVATRSPIPFTCPSPK